MKLKQIYEEVLREAYETRITAYHGTNHDIDKFSDSFVSGDGNIQHHGAGIYFATSYENARMFGKNVYEVELIGNFISDTAPVEDADSDKLVQLMKLRDEDEWELHAQDYHPDPETGLMIALEDALDQENEAAAYMRIQNGWYLYDELDYIRAMTKIGIDGVIVTPPSDWADKGEKHIIMFNPNAIKLIEKLPDTVEEDIEIKNVSDDEEYWDRVKLIVTNNDDDEVGYAILDMWIDDSEWSYMDDDEEGKYTDDEFDKHFPDGGAAKLEHLEVYPEYRNKGYATQLMQEVVKYIKSRGVKTIYLIASPTGYGNRIPLDSLTKFYQKYGFNVTKSFGNANDMVSQIGEELTYRYSDTNGVEDDEYEIGMVKENLDLSRFRFNDGRFNKNGANTIYMDDNPIIDFGVGELGQVKSYGKVFNNAIFLKGGFNASEQGKGYGRIGLEFIFSKLPKIQYIILECLDSAKGFWDKMGGQVIGERPYVRNRENSPTLYTMVISRDGSL